MLAWLAQLRSDNTPEVGVNQDGRCAEELHTGEAVRQAFAAVVADDACLPEGGTLGFEAAHLYEEKELSATEKAPAGVGASARVILLLTRLPVSRHSPRRRPRT